LVFWFFDLQAPCPDKLTTQKKSASAINNKIQRQKNNKNPQCDKRKRPISWKFERIKLLQHMGAVLWVVDHKMENFKIFPNISANFFWSIKN